MLDGGEPDDVTYRSALSSVLAAFLIFTYGFILLALPAALLTSIPLVVVLAVPVPIAVWRAATVSVTLGVDEVVVRNLTGTRRVHSVTKAVPEPRGPRGQRCITFSGKEGRAVPAFAMIVWSRGLRHERPTASTERLSACLQTWASECRERRGVEVQLDPNYRDPDADRRERFATVRNQMSVADPVESMRAVRRALVGSTLISVRPTADGFRVYVDAEDGSQLFESMDYPMMDSAIHAAIEEIARRTQDQPDE